MAGIGKALRGIGNVLKKYKNKESTLKWVDRHTNPGEVKPGKLLKNTLKGIGGATAITLGVSKIKQKIKKGNKDK
jgi:hypothetical protein